MPWTKKNFPDSMKNLPAAVRNKAIDIANAMLEEKHMKESIAIPTAISRAKDWAANRGMKTENKSSRTTDVKKHGEDRYVEPAEHGWKVKREKAGSPQHFDTKKEAVSAAKKDARKANASVTIKNQDGKIADRVSYNPHNPRSKQ